MIKDPEIWQLTFVFKTYISLNNVGVTMGEKSLISYLSFRVRSLLKKNCTRDVRTIFIAIKTYVLNVPKH